MTEHPDPIARIRERLTEVQRTLRNASFAPWTAEPRADGRYDIRAARVGDDDSVVWPLIAAGVWKHEAFAIVSLRNTAKDVVELLLALDESRLKNQELNRRAQSAASEARKEQMRELTHNVDHFSAWRVAKLLDIEHSGKSFATLAYETEVAMREKLEELSRVQDKLNVLRGRLNYAENQIRRDDRAVMEALHPDDEASVREFVKRNREGWLSPQTQRVLLAVLASLDEEREAHKRTKAWARRWKRHASRCRHVIRKCFPVWRGMAYENGRRAAYREMQNDKESRPGLDLKEIFKPVRHRHKA